MLSASCRNKLKFWKHKIFRYPAVICCKLWNQKSFHFIFVSAFTQTTDGSKKTIILRFQESFTNRSKVEIKKSKKLKGKVRLVLGQSSNPFGSDYIELCCKAIKPVSRHRLYRTCRLKPSFRKQSFKIYQISKLFWKNYKWRWLKCNFNGINLHEKQLPHNLFSRIIALFCSIVFDGSRVGLKF